jgi:hypothetical protein
MTTNNKRTAAINWPENYAPSGMRLLWWLGINLRLPHFLPLYINALLFTSAMAMFMLAWNVLLSVIKTGSHNYFSTDIAIMCVVYGIAMAIYFQFLKRKHNLPSWNELGVEPE